MNITLHSLLRGYAVFAVSSYDRLGHRCGDGARGTRQGRFLLFIATSLLVACAHVLKC